MQCAAFNIVKKNMMTKKTSERYMLRRFIATHWKIENMNAKNRMHNDKLCVYLSTQTLTHRDTLMRSIYKIHFQQHRHKTQLYRFTVLLELKCT